MRLKIAFAVLLLAAAPPIARGVEPFPLVVPVSREATSVVSQIESSMRTNDANTIEVPWNNLLKLDESELLAVSKDHLLSAGLARELLESRLRDVLKRQLGLTINSESGNIRTGALEDDLWLRGDIQAARVQWLEQLPNRAVLDPDWRLQPVEGDAIALIAARLILADMLDHRPHSAMRRLDLHREALDVKAGSLAGLDGNWGEILDDKLAEKTAHPSHIHLPRLHRLLWSVELPDSEFTHVTSPDVHGKTVVVPVQGGLRAIDLETGKARWPVDKADTGELFRVTNSDLQTVSRSSSTQPSAPMKMDHGTVMNGTLSGDLWMGRFGPHWRRPPQAVARGIHSQVLAFDLTAEGRIAWRFLPTEMNRFAIEKASTQSDDPSESDSINRAADEQWIVTGTPIVSGHACFVPCRSADSPPRLQLACLDSMNGNLSSIIPCGIAIEPRAKMPMNGNDQLTAIGNNVYWNVDGAAMIAADMETGSLRWLRRLDARQFSNSNSTSNDNDATSVETDASIFPWNQQLITTSHGTISAIDHHSGALNWRTELHDPTARLVGAEDNAIIIAGQFLWGLREDDGHILWRTGFVDNPQRTSATMIDGSILWLNGTELWSVNPINGDVLQRVDLAAILPNEVPSSSLPTEMTATAGIVFLSNPRRLTAISLFASQDE